MEPSEGRAIIERLDSLRNRMDRQDGRIGEIVGYVRQPYENTSRLMSLELKVDEIQKDVQDIKAGPVYSLDRAINKKIAKSGGILMILLIFVQSLAMI